MLRIPFSLAQLRLPFSLSQLRILFWLGIAGTLAFFGFEEWSLLSAGMSDRIAEVILKDSGDLAWRLLVFTIFVSLIRKLFPNFALASQLLVLRKETGVLAFFFALAHGIAFLISSGVSFFDPAKIFTTTTADLPLTAGTLSLVIMLPLAATSTTWAVKKMGGRTWKNLQRFTHVAFVLAALHVALIGEFEPGPLVLLAVYATGYAWLVLKNSTQKYQHI